MENKDFIFMNNPTAETEQVKVIPKEFSFVEKLNALIKYVNSLPIKPESEVIERLENVEKIMAGYDNRLTNVETGLQTVNTDIGDVNTNLTTTNNLVNTNVKDIEQIKQHATQTDSTIEDIILDVSDIQQTDLYIKDTLATGNYQTTENNIITLNKPISDYDFLEVQLNVYFTRLYSFMPDLYVAYTLAVTGGISTENATMGFDYCLLQKQSETELKVLSIAYSHYLVNLNNILKDTNYTGAVQMGVNANNPLIGLVVGGNIYNVYGYKKPAFKNI